MTRTERQANVARFLKRISSQDSGLESLQPAREMDRWLEAARVRMTGGGQTRLPASAGLESVGETVTERAPPLVALDSELEAARRGLIKLGRDEPLEPLESSALEAIVLPQGRPVLDIIDGVYAQPGAPWEKLDGSEYRTPLQRAIRSIGRIEIPDHPSLPYAGTGFVVGDGLIMTNRHVAELFVTGLGIRNLEFRPGLERDGIDFVREIRHREPSTLFMVERVLMVHPYWDMALLRVTGLTNAQEKLTLDPTPAADLVKRDVVVIGYPAFDPRSNEAVQERIFGGVYQVKRFQPGMAQAPRRVNSFGNRVEALVHDSSTLGGNSGSAVLDARTGHVLGLHFGGVYLDANYAVPMYELSRDPKVVDAGVNFKSTPPPAPVPWARSWDILDREEAPPRREASTKSVQLQRASLTPAAATVSIPLVVTVRLGRPVNVAGPSRALAATPAAPDDEEDEVERPVASYDDRKGYQPGFLGDGFEVPLPELRGGKADALTFGPDDETELRYEHFSVVMSRSRRLCRFSACNVDGGKSRKVTRGSWRYDPRIPKKQQVKNECYGSPPKFSRGHMTRREDPAWGSAKSASLGNEDSMHVTNVTPQMQAFNSPIWLGLEDYALQNARRDEMKISVFTGPYLEEDDPTIDKVKIPRSFWKVIAFIHDRTGELCATGYEMSQESNLENKEFIFADYHSSQLNVSTQVSIASIEQRAGIDFGGLSARDPMNQEGMIGEAVPLLAFEQIRFA